MHMSHRSNAAIRCGIRKQDAIKRNDTTISGHVFDKRLNGEYEQLTVYKKHWHAIRLLYFIVEVNRCKITVTGTALMYLVIKHTKTSCRRTIYHITEDIIGWRIKTITAVCCNRYVRSHKVILSRVFRCLATFWDAIDRLSYNWMALDCRLSKMDILCHLAISLTQINMYFDIAWLINLMLLFYTFSPFIHTISG